MTRGVGACSGANWRHGGVPAATTHVWQNRKIYEHHKVKVKLKQQTARREMC
jgi:hypothetical protein